MPMPTCRCTAAVSPRMTTTGQDAWAAAYRLTDPSATPTRRCRGSQHQHQRARSACGDRLRGRACQRDGIDLQAGGHRGGLGRGGAEGLVALLVDQIGDEVRSGRTWSPIIAGTCTADTIRSGAPRTTASRAAHSTALSDSSEPSVAATRGFAIMAGLLPGQTAPECAGKRHSPHTIQAFPRTACSRAFGQRAVGRSDRYLAGRRSLRIAEAIADSHYVLTWRDLAADALPSTRRRAFRLQKLKGQHSCLLTGAGVRG